MAAGPEIYPKKSLFTSLGRLNSTTIFRSEKGAKSSLKSTL